MKAEAAINVVTLSESGLFYGSGGETSVQGSGDTSNFLLVMLAAMMQQQNGGLPSETKEDNLTQAFSFLTNVNQGGEPSVMDIPMSIWEGFSEESSLPWQAVLYHTMAVNDPLLMTSGVRLTDLSMERSSIKEEPGAFILPKGVISILNAGGRSMEAYQSETEMNIGDVVNLTSKPVKMSLLNSDTNNSDKPGQSELAAALKVSSIEQNSMQLLRLNQIDGEVVQATAGLEMLKPVPKVQGSEFEKFPETVLENPTQQKKAGIQDGVPGLKQLLEAGHAILKEQNTADIIIRDVEQAGSENENHIRGEIIKVDAGITNLGNVTDKKFPSLILPQVISSLKYMTPDNGRVTVINLKLVPENMGEINVRLAYVKGELTAHFFTNSGLVKDAVEYSLPQLREALAQQNIELGEAAAFVGQEHQGRGGAHSWNFEGSKNRQRGVNGINYNGNQPGVLPVLAGKVTNVKSLNMLI